MLTNVQVMTNIGAACLLTIGVFVLIELAVQFGKYHHRCVAGIGEAFLPPSSKPYFILPKPYLVSHQF